MQQRTKQKLERELRFILPFLQHPEIVEIMVNPDGNIWCDFLGVGIKKVGTIALHHVQAIIETVAASLDKIIDKEHPLLEGELLYDGSRFAAQYKPVVSRPCFTIRKKALKVFPLEDYVNRKILNKAHYQKLVQAVEAHKNILVIGGTGSGKTTFVNAIINEMVHQYPQERMIIIEDTGEIQCSAENFVKFCTSPEIDMAALLRTSLRMRPDRIFVGEVRGAEALDLLDAWNTGHEGGAATLHANNVETALSRLSSLVSRNKSAPRDIPSVIGEVVHLIVEISKTPTGRKVSEVLEILGYKDNKYITKKL